MRVGVNLEQDHTVQRRSCGRVPGGARLHDYWQQASKRGAAKEVRFPVDFAQMATGSAAPITAASEMRRRWCVKKDVVAVRVL